MSDKIWLLDSGARCHVASDAVWFHDIISEIRDNFRPGKLSKTISKTIVTVKLVL